MLVLTEDVVLVLGLRYALLQHGYDLSWTNSFWMALSYLHARGFSSLIVDMNAGTIEDRFVTHLVEEYDRASTGAKVFVAAAAASPALRRVLGRNRRHVMLDDRGSAESVMAALGFEAP